jgi:hypothetical protein
MQAPVTIIGSSCRPDLVGVYIVTSCPLSWEILGLADPGHPGNAAVSTWESALQRISYVLADKDFAQAGDLIELRSQVGKRGLIWAALAAISRKEWCAEAREHGSRPANVTKLTRCREQPVFNTSFVYGNVQESEAVEQSNGMDGTVMRKHRKSKCQEKTKRHLQRNYSCLTWAPWPSNMASCCSGHPPWHCIAKIWLVLRIMW